MNLSSLKIQNESLTKENVLLKKIQLENTTKSKLKEEKFKNLEIKLNEV